MQAKKHNNSLIYLLKSKSVKGIGGWSAPKKASAYKLRIRFIVPAQEAKAVAPLAPIFGQFGLNCPDFCKQFNEKTAGFEAGLILTVYLEILFDRTFRFEPNRIFFTELMISSAEMSLLEDETAFHLILIHMHLYKKSFRESLKIVGGTFHASTLNLVPSPTTFKALIC